MTKYLLVLMMLFVIAHAKPQEQPDSITIYSMNWSSKTIVSYSVKRFLNEAESEYNFITKIVSKDTSYIESFNAELTKLKDTIANVNFDVRCVCLINSESKQDTLAFTRLGQKMYYNGKYYKINWKLVYLISLKLPLQQKFGIDALMKTQKYNEE